MRIDTPLLIPSFSSKGFAGSGLSSEVAKMLKLTSEWITEVYLISAYDISRGHIPKPGDLPVKPELIVVDSGGYEISSDYDMSEILRPSRRRGQRKWSLPELEKVMDDWPAQIPAMFVNYDHPDERKSVTDQIRGARDLFRRHAKNQLQCFLLKEEKTSQSTLKEAIASAMTQAEEFASFDVVAITEKGLGESPIDRMAAIARLRRALDEANCRMPIHVFGSLDPLSICLYTIAGAEIFDGLTWLRYAFAEDHQCVYTHSHATLRFGLNTSNALQRARVINDNIHYLRKLQDDLREFAVTKEFRLLPNSEWMKDAFSRLKTRMSKYGRQR